MVGAGGSGILFSDVMMSYRFDQAGACVLGIITVIIVLVIGSEVASHFLRERFQWPNRLLRSRYRTPVPRYAPTRPSLFGKTLQGHASTWTPIASPLTMKSEDWPDRR
ncbi:MAG: hypothetical protein OXI73_10425 [Rhodospirillales bacterium]|nr:hypothetical protein [Rhodospirillales bacterium]